MHDQDKSKETNQPDIDPRDDWGDDPAWHASWQKMLKKPQKPGEKGPDYPETPIRK